LNKSNRARFGNLSKPGTKRSWTKPPTQTHRGEVFQTTQNHPNVPEGGGGTLPRRGEGGTPLGHIYIYMVIYGRAV